VTGAHLLSGWCCCVGGDVRPFTWRQVEAGEVGALEVVAEQTGVVHVDCDLHEDGIVAAVEGRRAVRGKSADLAGAADAFLIKTTPADVILFPSVGEQCRR